MVAKDTRKPAAAVTLATYSADDIRLAIHQNWPMGNEHLAERD
jgi:hypothetical protein